MKKIFILPMLILLMNGCAESIALLGTGASNGRIVQSSLNSAISYNVKKQTGKTPLEHAVAYAEKKNPNKKKETCISFIEKTRSEFCTIVNKQISSTNIAVKEKTLKAKEKTLEIVKKYPKKSPRELAIALQTKIKEKSNNKSFNQYLLRN